MATQDEDSPIPTDGQGPFRTFVRVGEEDPLPELLRGNVYDALQAHRATLEQRLPKGRQAAFTRLPVPWFIVLSTMGGLALAVIEWGPWYPLAMFLFTIGFFASATTYRRAHPGLTFEPDTQRALRSRIEATPAARLREGVREEIQTLSEQIARLAIGHRSYLMAAILAGNLRQQAEQALETLVAELNASNPDAVRTHEALRETFTNLQRIKRHLEDGSVPLPEPPRGRTDSPYAPEGAFAPIPRRASACGDPDCGS